jgi:hypothetical protein
MDTYNDTKNAEYKTPQNKTSKVAFLFFLRELKKTTKITSMIIIINRYNIRHTINDHHHIIIINHHHQSYHDPKKNFIHHTINQSSSEKKILNKKFIKPSRIH